METKKKELTKKEKVGGCLTIIVFSIIIVICFLTCGENKEKPKAHEKEYDKNTLYNNISENMNILEGMTVEINEFDNNKCSIRVTVPEDMGRTGADIIGKGICIISTQWLKENNYNIDYNGIQISCIVVSPYIGVTEKPNMLIWWGSAYYNPNSDTVDWEWNKRN